MNSTPLDSAPASHGSPPPRSINEPLATDDGTAAAPSERFTDAATRRVTKLQAAFGAITRVIGSSLTPVELADALKVDRKLGWRLHRLANSASPIAGVEYLPGDEGVEILLRGAARRGVEDKLLQDARLAVREYRNLQTLYAGDRATLESMLTPLAPADAESQRMQMQLRKELFLAHSRMWGIRGRVQLRADFIHPSSAKAGWEDIATIRAFIDLVRLRPELRWILPRAKITDERRTTTLGGWYPIDPQAYMAYGAPIMPEYCTAPLPSLQDEPARPLPNTDRFMLADWPVGVRSPVTVVMGEAGDAMTPSWTNDPTFKGESYTRAYTPVELLVMDHFVHKDLFGRLDPTLHVLGDLGPWMPYPVQGELRNEIAVAERVQFLGRGISCATLPAMNNYAQLLAEVCTRQHWNPTDFDVYRVRIEFPPVPCTVSLRYPMPLRDEPINHTGV